MNGMTLLSVGFGVISGGIAITIGVIAARRRKKPGAVSLIVFSLALAIWVIAQSVLEIFLPASGSLLQSISYLGATITATTLLTFTLEYTNHRRYLTRRLIALLAVEPVLIQVLLWTSPWHGSFFAEGASGISAMFLPETLWPPLNGLYSYTLMLVALFLLVQTSIRKPRPFRQQSRMFIAGALAPLLVYVVSFVRSISILGLDLTSIAFTFTGLVFICSLLRYRLLDLVPIPREIVIERMKEGWMVLDSTNRVVDLNRNAEAVIGLPRDKIIGQEESSILSNMPNLKNIRDVKEVEIEGSVNMGGEHRYLNTRISPLLDEEGNSFGKVIVWRDNTERRKADEARQRARDEMFVLLHTISSAASRAQSLNDFLATSMYQIVYTFKSQASAIFLLDDGRDNDGRDNNENKRLILAAHHNLPAELIGGLNSFPVTGRIMPWVMKECEPLLVKDIEAEPNIPTLIKQIGYKCLLFVPMVMDRQTLGVICLARKDGTIYSTDEIARLAAVAEEMATFVHSDRRKQLVVSMQERQRLVHYLHDSVTQKLYGLVMMTEAAQAALENGVNDTPARLARICENARQALKEMRLFLFELQPVDLEHLGLVAVLHQRLAAVEGRADVKINLLTDRKISLPLDKQVALYFIAQEALNNVMRHAHAQSVTIHLHQTKEVVRLKIMDDGKGFDPKKIAPGHLGIRIMRERASQIDGKLRVSSTPGKGAKISVSVRRDKRSKEK